MVILMIPLVILSIAVAGRKGKSMVKYGLLAIIPIANLFCFLYLISLTDKKVTDKLDSILEILEKNRTLERLQYFLHIGYYAIFYKHIDLLFSFLILKDIPRINKYRISESINIPAL